jgi:hypothetical protein
MARKARPIIGEPHGGESQNEREHFINCAVCGRWIDMRDLGEVLAHERACEGTPVRTPH